MACPEHSDEADPDLDVGGPSLERGGNLSLSIVLLAHIDVENLEFKHANDEGHRIQL